MASEHDTNADKLFDFPGRMRSEVWKHFGFRKVRVGPVSKDSLDMENVVCKLCMKSYKYKGACGGFVDILFVRPIFGPCAVLSCRWPMFESHFEDVLIYI